MAASNVQTWLERYWYGSRPVWVLLPLQPLYSLLGVLRRFLYRRGLKASWRAPVPVLVVGNLSVGGTGKTPLTIALVEAAQTLNLRVGVISRGYGRKSDATTVLQPSSMPDEVGDEPLLIFQRSGAPVAVASKRVDAAKALLATGHFDLLIADDGLQHYALQRDLECVVVDGQRSFGNGWQLPCGPLREPVSRLALADAVVVNKRSDTVTIEVPAKLPAELPIVEMQLKGDVLVNLLSGESKLLTAFNGQAVAAMAGIGNPQAFFDRLSKDGLLVDALSFPDHHSFTVADLPQATTVVMTEKDAVKLKPLAHSQCWYMPVSAQLPVGFATQLIQQTIAAFEPIKRA